ncbi:HET-domain-containing protein [Lojkania enalia]|uniref:HET-domain-containing protein n=1 Tax=Lojkania enalia TaxID=147567 RepID=A0A9P4MZS8_9PLEO|nr:HET-domain-containing protein [Didymosphaeria enalia]
MRLLEFTSGNSLVLTKDFIGDDKIPPYAILSHTWEDGQEVDFTDVRGGTGQDKTGYNKILFCKQQAERDGLQYFWIDTCCIDKSNHVELQDAINSMFRWYQNAEKCYVYLSDVLIAKRKASDEFSECTWETAFRGSKWFTRGWTLQELLAPRSVGFFSREGKLLGNKTTLERQIHEITGINHLALRGTPLYEFSVETRLSWAKGRKTTRKEDRAYSLLGIFGIYMSLIYGEGEDNAFKRLQKKINRSTGAPEQQTLAQKEREDQQCIQHLRLTDPRDDKKRIEETKGGILENSYRWVLENSDFQRWRDEQESRLLWIKGDPGKGKTMLLCGIINELKKSMTKANLMSYFFCQATDSHINNATAVLRGLIYLLVDQQPSLISHVRKKHDHAGKSLFEDANVWVALSEIFINILQDPSLNSVNLIIDALDECIVDLPKLLDFVIRTSSISSHVKWIVSSRNCPNIEECLERERHKVRLSLELNTASVSAAVRFYIRHRVTQLAQEKNYSHEIQNAVLAYLSLNANDTFLWVALVCQNLKKISRWKVLAKLKVFPPGLNYLYKRMMQYISTSDDAALCKRILASIAVVYRPITLEELTALVEELKDMANDLESLREIIGLCGSFLTIRNSIIYFVHQSAQDFLLTEEFNTIFPSGKEEVHYVLFSRSLLAISKTLRRDIYSLHALRYPIEQVTHPTPDPLAVSRYSCIYWIDHLYDCNPRSSVNHRVDLQDGGAVDIFLRERYLYWLEALSLCRSMSKGVVSMAKLEAVTDMIANASLFDKLVRDARRFIMYHKWAIENSPLQAYASALVFSPTYSFIRRLFKKEDPKWISNKPDIGERWGTCLQTLEGHSHIVGSVAFSHDSTRLASASHDRVVRVWDASSGECIYTLEGHSDSVSSVAFSRNSTRLASASHDCTVRVWDASRGECVHTLEHLVWLPPEYRPLCSAVSGNTIGIGTGSGRVWIFRVQLDTP